LTDTIKQTLTLAFGVLIVLLVVASSLWIIADLYAALMPTAEPMQMPMLH
jgi:heme/copper-type cytochrome/quinol oxidase subunit 4